MFGKHAFAIKMGMGRGRHGRGHGHDMRGDFFKRMRRGDIKFHIMEILKDTPRHGYEIITELEKQSGGYRPSPGSVYPTLQMLEEAGHLTSEQVEGKKVYTITEDGLKLLAERGETRFEADPKMTQFMEMRKDMMRLHNAVMEGVRDGNEDRIKRINEIVTKARRDIYSILAE